MPDVTRDKFEGDSYHVLEPKRARGASTYNAALGHFQQVPVLRFETNSAKLALLLVRTSFAKTAQCFDKALILNVIRCRHGTGPWGRGVIDCRLRGSVIRVSLKSVRDNLGYYNDSISLYLAAMQILGRP